MRIAPSRSFCAAVATDASSVTSSSTALMRPPVSLRRRAAAASPFCRSRAPTSTSHPAPASTRATCCPIPRLPPGISTVLAMAQATSLGGETHGATRGTIVAMFVDLAAEDGDLLERFYREVYLPEFAAQREPLEAWRAALEADGPYRL